MLSFVELFNDLRRQRYCSIILHSKPNVGLSEFAKKSASAIGARYINLQELFIKNEELSNKINSYSDQDFLEFLTKENKDATALIIDKIDFLLDTWNNNEMDSFLNLFKNQWDTFKSVYKIPLIVFIETNNQIDELKINFENGKTKIYQLSHFNAI